MAGLKDFADLKSLGKQLREQGEERKAAEAERVKREKVQAQEANLFQANLAGVKRMAPSDRYVPKPPSAPAMPVAAGPRKPLTAKEQAEDDQAVLRESLSDLFEVDHYMEEDPSLNYAAPGVGPDVVKKMRKGHWPVQAELDLHGLNRDGARDALGDFLRKAVMRNQRCVCVIHGRGLGSRRQEPVLKSMVHSWLVQTDGVIAFCQARSDEGGEGALIVLLRAALQPQR
ncbi:MULTISPECIES: Smr/MutS family protein [unclassified Massilia]|uniref:Smr/MutS family protein n=1 Tax=unclassified Massilia TaxID=2609279 RepID=UPI0021053C16|nr:MULTISPECIES: Smr/MutS family protein [unclassified Massilia]UTY60282.1 DNA mismatch repair protein MutS [Massilia sp. erpn]